LIYKDINFVIIIIIIIITLAYQTYFRKLFVTVV